ncbi:hypothetical protein NM688_g1240 [Phlebia brevispora]|uniref:Uncharacterized protein n=1 Tax=Phlebia brevispora TaxID=194682 RepID=A0ACC1TCD2_9APHY|nr:hypothetical protein NM688_g1240 [Phlebia brevispora]
MKATVLLRKQAVERFILNSSSGAYFRALVRQFSGPESPAAQVKVVDIDLDHLRAAYTTIKPILPTLTSARSLTIRNGSVRNSDWLRQFLDQCPGREKVKHLEIHGAFFIRLENLTKIISRFPSLVRLSIVDATWTQTDYIRLPLPPRPPGLLSLRELRLQECRERVNNRRRVKIIPEGPLHLLDWLFGLPRISNISLLELGWEECLTRPRHQGKELMQCLGERVQDLAILPPGLRATEPLIPERVNLSYFTSLRSLEFRRWLWGSDFAPALESLPSKTGIRDLYFHCENSTKDLERAEITFNRIDKAIAVSALSNLKALHVQLPSAWTNKGTIKAMIQEQMPQACERGILKIHPATEPISSWETTGSHIEYPGESFIGIMRPVLVAELGVQPSSYLHITASSDGLQGHTEDGGSAPRSMQPIPKHVRQIGRPMRCAPYLEASLPQASSYQHRS